MPSQDLAEPIAPLVLEGILGPMTAAGFLALKMGTLGPKHPEEDLTEWDSRTHPLINR